MPRYEYSCPKCGSFEVTQKISDPPLRKHECGEEVVRQIAMTAFSLKGGGWYADGYGCKPSGCEKPGCAAKSEAA